MRHRLFLLGLLVLTVASVGAASPTPWTPSSVESLVRVAARAVLVGVLVLLWAYWLRAEKRSS